VIASPVSFANWASSHFHNRTRYPLEPPGIRADKQPLRFGVATPSNLHPPATQRFNRERGGVAIGAHRHPAGVSGR
jgi:hypothetical protein